MSYPPALMLLGIVVASAIGALVLSALLFRHGVAPDSDGDAFTTHRLFVFRVAHVLALGCFAISVTLGVAAASIAWRAQSRASEVALDDTIAMRRELRQQRDGLLERVQGLEQRLTAAERHLETMPPTAAVRSDIMRGETPRRAGVRSAKPSAASRRPRETSVHAPSASPRRSDPSVQAEMREEMPAASSRFVSSASPAVESSPSAFDPPQPGPGSFARSASGVDVQAPAPDTAMPASCDRTAHRLCSRVAQWGMGEVNEFRDGMRQEVAEFREGFGRVTAGLRRIRDTFAR